MPIYTSTVRPTSRDVDIKPYSLVAIVAKYDTKIKLKPNVTYIKLPPVTIEYDVLIYDDGYYQYTDANDQLRID